MKNILLKITGLTIFATVFLVANYASAESFYAKLGIKEVKSGSNIVFSLDGASAIYGDYNSFYQEYLGDGYINTSDYILETFDKDKKEQKKYQLKSSRFMFVDGTDAKGEPTGGAIESDSGVISAVVPYDREKPTGYIKIDNKGKKTGFITIPTDQIEKDFKDIPLCIEENEEVDLNNKGKCCSGLTTSSQDDGTYFCVKCGDSKCSDKESYLTCPEDCLAPVMVASVSFSESMKKLLLNLFTGFNVIISIVLILAVFILLFNLIQKIRKGDRY